MEPVAGRDDALTQPTSQPADEAGPLRDRGMTLLATVACAMLPIVALAWLVGAIDHWWVLIPVIALVLALTAVVLVMITRLLDED
jgi:membrane protein YdbS with pleckstrin-like domain